MADKRRFDFFADYIVRRFPDSNRIFDVAGGMGMLNLSLTQRGRDCTTFDRRHKHLDVKFAERIFTVTEPPQADLVVGMHPDGATRIIIEYAAYHSIPFAIVPCCSDNSMSYKPWVRFLVSLANSLRLETEEFDLPMEGRSKVISGVPAVSSIANIND